MRRRLRRASCEAPVVSAYDPNHGFGPERRDLAILIAEPTAVGHLLEIAEELDAQPFIDVDRFLRAAARFRIALIGASGAELPEFLRRLRTDAPETLVLALLSRESAQAEQALRRAGALHVAVGRIEPAVLRDIIERAKRPAPTTAGR